MRVPYGPQKEYFTFSLFLVFCNRITTSAVSAGVLLASKKALDPVAPLYKYCVVSVSNILTTTCQYEALKYVSFPVQTLAKCAKMIPVMIWGTIIMQKKYKGQDYLVAFLVTLGCSLFILYQAAGDISPFNRGRESTVWGVSLMIGYLGINFLKAMIWKYRIKYSIQRSVLVFLVSSKIICWTIWLFQCLLAEHDNIQFQSIPACMFFMCTMEGRVWLLFLGLILQGNLLMAIDFVSRHHYCFFDIALLSTVATASQFFISYTIRTFGALTFATIMTTRQLVSILLSCLWFGHPLGWEQCIGAVIVFGSLYARTFLKTKQKSPSLEMTETRASGPS
ncbi:UDP-galactose/UDP-glucose transporter 5 isoform X3 [Nicotiana tabacum]|nr:PREDICTED: UDP-galactose/UDP-glucose transporter 5-like isoform X3 [Nicotiana tabacum]